MCLPDLVSGLSLPDLVSGLSLLTVIAGSIRDRPFSCIMPHPGPGPHPASRCLAPLPCRPGNRPWWRWSGGPGTHPQGLCRKNVVTDTYISPGSIPKPCRGAGHAPRGPCYNVPAFTLRGCGEKVALPAGLRFGGCFLSPPLVQLFPVRLPVSQVPTFLTAEPLTCIAHEPLTTPFTVPWDIPLS